MKEAMIESQNVRSSRFTMKGEPVGDSSEKALKWREDIDSQIPVTTLKMARTGIRE